MNTGYRWAIPLALLIAAALVCYAATARDSTPSKETQAGATQSTPDSTPPRTDPVAPQAPLDSGQLSQIEVASVPDGLGDLVALRRAQAATGDPGHILAELSRPELRSSANRLILEQAGHLAEQAGDPGLAGELYARGAGYFGWTVERTRVYSAAAEAFERAGRPKDAIEQYRTLLESYGWTQAGQEAGAALWRLDALTPFYHGLLAITTGRFDEARTALKQAAANGEHAAAAESRLESLEEALAWQVADSSGTVADYQWMQGNYPEGPHAAEACFQQGFVHYRAGELAAALGVWEEGASTYTGDDRARMLLWAGIVLGRLGRGDEMWAEWRRAADTHPAGYYTLRTRDLLAGVENWPTGGDRPSPSDATERAEAEKWLASWAGPEAPPKPDEDLRVRRGFGLLSLGFQAEAETELNGLVADSRDPWLSYRLAGRAAERKMWTPSSRAAARVVALSPARTSTEAPRALQRLVYPSAYPDLVIAQAEQREVEPLLLLALIHQESRYDPFAVSTADARGLSQVMPSTGRALAADLGLPSFEPEDLYDPAVALRFGSYYLANQLAAFEGDPFKALAAYNAGGRPVARWDAADPDLFVERIDYPETRAYVRQIYVHHAVYRALADG